MSKSVIVSMGDGSLDMMLGTSRESSEGTLKPSCLMHGSFLRVLRAIQRRIDSLA